MKFIGNFTNDKSYQKCLHSIVKKVLTDFRMWVLFRMTVVMHYKGELIIYTYSLDSKACKSCLDLKL